MQNLHDIIEEQEGKIFELEAQLQGNYSGTGWSNLHA